MKYENGKNIFPEKLLRKIQKYAAGRIVYIPSPDGRRPWGETTGYRKILKERNARIMESFTEGASIDELSDKYYLTPETIKKIVYSKKERRVMELDAIYALYNDRAPDEHVTVWEDEWDEDWGSGFCLALNVRWDDKWLAISVDDFEFTTHEYVKQWDKTIAAYNALGYRCTALVRNKYGELSRTVNYNGRSCIVFAEKRPEYKVASSLGWTKLDLHGRFIFHDDTMRAVARAASLHLSDMNGANAEALFIPTPNVKFDWVTEMFCDVKDSISECFPQYLEKLGHVERLFLDNRDKLEKIYCELPTSVFHSAPISMRTLLDEEDRLAGFCDFKCGGRDTCLNYILHSIIALVEYLPDDWEFKEITDGSVRKSRLDALERDIKLVSEIYRFSDDEVAAAPLLYKYLFVGSTYIPESVMKYANGDSEKIGQLLDYMEYQLTEQTVDFAGLMKR